MKHERRVSLLIAAALAFCISFGGIACLITAFGLAVDLWPIGVFCLLFSLVAAGMLSMQQGGRVLCILMVLVGGLFWNPGRLDDHVESLIYQLSVWYDSAYRWGVFHWSDVPPENVPVDLAMYAVAALVALVAAWTVIRRKPALFAVTAGIVPLCACLVVTDKVPSSGSLAVLITGLLLLILTHTVRRRKVADGNRLTAMMLIPAILCTALLFWAVPREGYEPGVTLPQWMQNLLSGELPDIGGDGGSEAISVDLTTVGPKSQATYTVMEVMAEQGGVLYLRGQAYDHYDGRGWSVSINAADEDNYWPQRGLMPMGMVTIRPRGNTDLMYFPYYPGTNWSSQIRFGRLSRAADQVEYSFERFEPITDSTLTMAVSRTELVKECLALPENTSTRAKEILRTIGLLGSLSDKKKANIISDYVRGLATYDLNTGRMPQNEEDFALWFIEDADTGYCIHFATAATVLLRAAGIPARYVTGYMTIVGSGGWANVVARESHAWVEYLDPERGWVLLDPTPPEPTLPTDPDDPTNPSDPEQTEPVGPTEPSVSDPFGTTEPNQTIPPSQGATNSTTIVTGGDVETPGKQDLTLLWRCLNILTAAVVTVAVLWGQYSLRLRHRRRKMCRGTMNQQALARWRDIVKRSRILRETLPEELEELAEKAKFSQHTLSQGELKQFKLHQQELSKILAQKPWYQQILLRLIFAAE